MKRMIILPMVAVAVFAVYALAQPAGDTVTSPAVTARTQPQNSPMQCGPGGRTMACKAGTCKAGTCKAGMCKAGMCKAGMCKAGMCKAGMCKAGMCKAAMCKGAMAGKPGMMACRMGMMRKAGMNPAMMKRMRVMMQTPIFMDSPGAVYSRAADLKLSAAQQAKLIKIENDSRRQALAVLTQEQRKQMGDIPAQPMAMMQMCRQMRTRMMPMMQKMMGSQGKSMMACPMMNMMDGKDQPMMKKKGNTMMNCPMMKKKGNTMMNCPMMNSMNPQAGKTTVSAPK